MLVEFLQVVFVHQLVKKSVSKRIEKQKIFWLKKEKSLLRDVRTEHTNHRVSSHPIYPLMPQNTLTFNRTLYTQCFSELFANVDLNLDVLNEILSGDINGTDVWSEMCFCTELTCSWLDRKCGKCDVTKVRSKLEENLQCSDRFIFKWNSLDRVQAESKKEDRASNKRGNYCTYV